MQLLVSHSLLKPWGPLPPKSVGSVPAAGEALTPPRMRVCRCASGLRGRRHVSGSVAGRRSSWEPSEDRPLQHAIRAGCSEAEAGESEAGAPHQFCLRGGPQDPQLRKYGLAAEQNQGGGRRGGFVHVSEPVARSEVQCLVPGKRGRNRPCEHFLRKGSSGPFLSLCTSAFRASRCFLISQGWISTFIFGIGKICPTGRTVENGTGRLSKRRTLAGGEEAG